MNAKSEHQDLAEPAADTTALRRLELAAATQPEDQETFWVRWNPYPGTGGRTWGFALDAFKSAGTRSEERRYSHEFVCVSREDGSGVFTQILGDPIQGFIVEIGGGHLDETYAATHQSGDGELIELQSLYRWWRPAPVPASQLWRLDQAVLIAVAWLKHGRIVTLLTPAPSGGLRN